MCVPIVGYCVGKVVLASIPMMIFKSGCSALWMSISALSVSYMLPSASEWISLACAVSMAYPSMCMASHFLAVNVFCDSVFYSFRY